MSRNFGLVAFVAVLIGLTFTSKGVSSPCGAEELPRARVLVTQQIVETRLIRLEGNTRREANANNDRGAVADDFPWSTCCSS